MPGPRRHPASLRALPPTLRRLLALAPLVVLAAPQAAGANQPPTLDVVAPLTITEDSGAQGITLTGIGDGGEGGQTLIISAVSSDHSVLLDPTVIYTSPAATATLRLAPVPDAFGTVTVTVTVSDDGFPTGTSTRTFTVTVLPVNDPPLAGQPVDLALSEDAPQQVVTLTGISAGPANESGQVLSVAAVSSRPDLIPSIAVGYTSPGASATLTFTPTPHVSGSAVILVTIGDNGGTANGGSATNLMSFNVVIAPIPHTPVVTVNSGLSLPIHGTAVVSATQLTVSDFGAPAQLVYHLAAAPTKGALSRAGTALSAGSTFTQADIDAGLLLYAHAGSVAESDGFTFTVTNSDGNALAPTSFAITIAGNLATTTPVVTLPGASPTWVQGSSAVAIDPTATVADPGSLVGGVLVVHETQNASAGDVLSFRSIGTGPGQVAVSGGVVTYQGATIGSVSGGAASDLVVVLAGSATPAGVQALLRTLQFANVDAAPSAAARRVQVLLTNGSGGTSAAVTKDVQVQPVNQAPQVGLPARTVAYLEGSGAQVLDGGATVIDADSPALTGGTLVAAWTANATIDDQLGIRDEGTGAGQVHVAGSAISVGGASVATLAGGSAGAALTVTFTAQATPAIAQAILRNLTFANASPTPSLALRQLGVVVGDGAGGTSAPASLTVVIEAVDNPPVVTLPSPGLLFLQGGQPQALDGLATLTDVDTSSYPTGLVIVDFTAGATADDQLSVLSQGNGAGQIAVSGSDVLYQGVPIGVLTAPGTIAGPLLVRLNASATLAATQALLRQIAFADVAVPPVSGPRTVRMVITDGDGGTSLPVTSTVTVQAVNVAPMLSMPDPPATWTQHDPPVLIGPGALLGDVDSADFNGGSLTVSSINLVAGDVLDLRSSGVGAGQVATSAGTVLVSGVAVGTYSGGAGPASPLVVHFGPLSSPGAAQAVLRAVVFSHVGEFTSAQTRHVAVLANDGQADGNTAGALIDMIPVDDPPTASAVTFGTVQDLARDVLLVGSDPEGGALTWALASQPAHGSATLLDATTGTVRYSPASGFTGSDSFTVTASDGVNISSPATVTMLVAAPLDATRPQVLTSPPREGFLTVPLTYDLVADTSLLPTNADLLFQAVGAPAGVVVVKTGAATATVTWTATGTPEEHQEITILVSDAVSGAATSQAIIVLWHAVGWSG